jgi:hypothetical protein
LHWKLKPVLTSNCICFSESKHSKIQPITRKSACYCALLKHFHVPILHNYSRSTIILKLFLQSNTEHNIQLHSQIRNINPALYFVGPRTKAQPEDRVPYCFPKFLKENVIIVHLKLGSSSFLPHPFQFINH